MIQTICVAGAGTMGSGIALLCGQHGFTTILFDVNADTLARSQNSITAMLTALVSKGKLSVEEQMQIEQRLTFTMDIRACVADVIIEAIIEKAQAKIALFKDLVAMNAEACIFASNTSSISISLLQESVAVPGRFAGMHFFNPAPVMKLVEIVVAPQTSTDTALALQELCEALGKTAVLCKDSPGFIVNRVARHYYLEAMKLEASGVASIEVIDEIMETNGFKMGPFRLMDLIGMDVNLAVSQTIYEAFDKAERFQPADLQQQKVKAGDLGKKTGKGFYTYTS
ncbi:MAG: 3-hydroxyacyl-CoA dehydrogenase NAD-binding domain-containing protein [Bacteroidota bacterium]